MNPSKAQPTRKETVRTAVTKPAIKFWALNTAVIGVLIVLTNDDPLNIYRFAVAYIGGSVITAMALGSK